MDKRNHKLLYVCFTIFLLLLISAVLFYTRTNKVTYSFVQTITESTVRTEVSQFDLNVDQSVRILQAIGEGLPDDLNTDDIEEVSHQLARYGVLYNIESLYLIRKDGTGITYNNQTSHLHFSDAYSLFTSGKSISTGIEIPNRLEETFFYVAIPIRKNQDVDYVLKAYYSNQTIKNILLFPFIENVRYGLVTQSGMAVTESVAKFTDLDFLQQLTIMKPGFFKYKLNDGDFLIYHSPTSCNGIYFFLEVPVKSINSMTRGLKQNGIAFAVIIIILSTFLIIFLVKSEHEQRNDILKLSEKLRHSEARYQNAFNYKDNIAWEYNPLSKELTAVIKRKDGRNKELKISNAVETLIQNKIIHPDYIDEFKRFAGQIFADPPYTTSILKLRALSGGDYYWARLSFIISSDEKTDTQTILGLSEDISDIKEVQDKYNQEKQTIAAMTDNSVCYYLLNLTTGLILEKKSRDIPKSDLEKLKTIEELVLKEISFVHDKDDIQKLKEACTVQKINELLESGKDFEDVEYRRRSPASGTIEWISLAARPMKTPNNDVVVAIQLVNIDNRKKQEMILQRHAERDLLTDLYNKMTMSSLINDYLKLDRKEGQIDALIMLDADNYKSVNDTFGHVFGDKVLIDIADSLKSNVKHCDLVGRVGGDEFMVFLKDMRCKDDIESILKRISEGIQHTYAENDVEVSISASIGVAYVTQDIKSFQPLYKLADEALYDAKKSGKNCYKFAKATE